MIFRKIETSFQKLIHVTQFQNRKILIFDFDLLNMIFFFIILGVIFRNKDVRISN